MSDLIRRSDAIEACAYETFECYEARKAIRNLPSADRPRGEWIPCSERLPREYSDGERVLATTDVDGLGVIIIPIYDVTSWYYKGYISAWMPLPKPYEECKESE